MELKTAILVFLVAAGVVAPLPEFAAGMVFCMFAAYIALYSSPPETKPALWFTLVLAVFCGILTANLHRSFFPNWDLRLMMAAAGGLSRFIVSATLSFGRALVDRAEKLPHSFKFPWEK